MVDLPYGGAKGGITCDSAAMSPGELERLTGKFIRQIHTDIGPTHDIPAPDVNTDAQVMAWVMSAYSQLHGFAPAVVTGKPLDLHGSQGREAATGMGLVCVIEEVLKDLGRALADTTFAIQGFGNVGSHTARLLHERGAKVLAASQAAAFSPRATLRMRCTSRYGDGSPFGAVIAGVRNRHWQPWRRGPCWAKSPCSLMNHGPVPP